MIKDIPLIQQNITVGMIPSNAAQSLLHCEVSFNFNGMIKTKLITTTDL